MPNETIEWTRCWREDADTDKKRVLLIGDSLIDGSKREVYYAMPEGWATTAVITSKGVDDPYYTREIELFCEQERFDYKAVYFNNGIHNHGQTPEAYARNLRTVLGILRRRIPKAVWVVGLCTPATPCDDTGKYHEAPVSLDPADGQDGAVRLILRTNEVIRAVAADLGLPVFDAYSLLAPHPEFKTDMFHLNEEGRRFFGRAIAAELTRRLGL